VSQKIRTSGGEINEINLTRERVLIWSSSTTFFQPSSKGHGMVDESRYSEGSRRNLRVLQGYKPYSVLKRGNGDGGSGSDNINAASFETLQ